MYSVHLILQEDEGSENEKDNEKGTCKLLYFFVVLLLLFFFALQTLSFKSHTTLLQIFQVKNPGEEKRLLSMMLIWLRNMQVTNFSYMFLIFERQK